ncbi:hypothetical protein SAMN05421823_101616 [Catalinimonas alkaloidigena]|uniref:Uncharacterized protein n=1 Tax=Catalinimonas alkaloidigena TaxID=1075417 RepID=A0A1G8YA75_9BACT|nr:hypothetical protein SAMN05421823_101616 [Catalinimonas alkaloidigena]
MASVIRISIQQGWLSGTRSAEAKRAGNLLCHGAGLRLGRPLFIFSFPLPNPMPTHSIPTRIFANHLKTRSLQIKCCKERLRVRRNDPFILTRFLKMKGWEKYLLRRMEVDRMGNDVLKNVLASASDRGGRPPSPSDGDNLEDTFICEQLRKKMGYAPLRPKACVACGPQWSGVKIERRHARFWQPAGVVVRFP